MGITKAEAKIMAATNGRPILETAGKIVDQLEAELTTEREKVRRLENSTTEAWANHMREQLDAAREKVKELESAAAVAETVKIQADNYLLLLPKLEMAEAVIAGDGALITSLQNDLASAQATIAEKNEALNYAAAAFRELAQENDGDYETAEQMEEAAALPTNQDALHEALARECERLKQRYRENSPSSWWLDEEAAAHRARKEQA